VAPSRQPIVRSPFFGSCQPVIAAVFATTYVTSKTEQVGPAAGTDLDSVYCGIGGHYRDLPTSGQANVSIDRLSSTAVAVPEHFADTLRARADEQIQLACGGQTTPEHPAMPATRYTIQCALPRETEMEVGLAATTDIGVVVIKVYVNYGNLDRTRVNTYANDLAQSVASAALALL
jgi:hypothetical protein